MPIYEYRCAGCNQTFSLLQRVGATAEQTVCPHCGAAQASRLVSCFASSSSTSPLPVSAGPGCGTGGFS